MSSIIVPLIIFIILFVGLIERIEVFNIFVKGAKEGISIVVNLFPTLIGIFLAISMLRCSGLMEFIVNKISIVTNIFNISSEIIPLILIKPISGSGAMAVGIDIMENFGVDSKLGMLAATIMGSSETTLYVIALYMSQINIKNNRKIIIPALLADLTSIIVAIILFKV